MTDVMQDSSYRIIPLIARKGLVRKVGRHVSGSEGVDTLDRLPPACVLEMEALGYSHNSAVTLPVLPTSVGNDSSQQSIWFSPGHKADLQRFHLEACNTFMGMEAGEEWVEEENWRRSSLVVLAITYRFLEKNPSYKLLIAGHTDTSGDDEYNFNLSELRAKNVLHLLQGERDKWIAICGERSKIEDYQTICRHYARLYLWDCDPGPIDGKHGPLTQACVKRLQASYNKRCSNNIDVDGVVGPETWGAIFDLYMEELAGLLGTSVNQLSQFRSKLRYVQPDNRYIACGERIPIDGSCRDNFRSATNRRVELLFFPETRPPDLTAHLQGGPIRSGRKGRAESCVYQAFSDFMLIEPIWWEGSVLRDIYSPRFELKSVDESLCHVRDDPESEEYTSECDFAWAESATDNDEDPWVFLDAMDNLGVSWSGRTPRASRGPLE